MPGGQPLFRSTHPNYEGPTLPDITMAEEEAYSELEMVTSTIQEVQGDPKTLSEACSHADWPLWQAAMEKEITMLKHAGTWTTVPRPTGRNIVGSKWVYQIKRKSDSSVDKYKARLVACGFTQVYGEDYYNTFSPVAKLSSFRTILALAARFNWEIDSFNFNGAYLNSKLDADEEIYMQEPPGYEGQGVDSVKRLRKLLYRLKQAR
jgi:hypothetical protein